MPVRFRCPHCNQLLGIARRKAGTNVQCPTCANSVLVPNQDEEPNSPPLTPAPPTPPKAPAADLFDRDDFDALLQRDAGSIRTGGAVRTPSPIQRPQPVEAPSWPAPVPPTVGGLVLSPGRATVLTVVLILLLATAFVSGLLVGRFVL